jgi:ferric-dicitrate binding protein FerR (iron transport regulator)
MEDDIAVETELIMDKESREAFVRVEKKIDDQHEATRRDIVQLREKLEAHLLESLASKMDLEAHLEHHANARRWLWRVAAGFVVALFGAGCTLLVKIVWG